MYTLNEALDSVKKKNRLNAQRYTMLETTFQRVFQHIPILVKQEPSFCVALRGQGRYISINIMNYLIYRTPAYSDRGDPPAYDCHILFEDDPPLLDHLPRDRNRQTFQFRDFPCINLGLFFEEVLDFQQEDWDAFANACMVAMTAKRSRSWPSNIDWKQPLSPR
ncbi:MAG: hypothetical protein Fur005_10500 [Roseiflexaceae bacterium]